MNKENDGLALLNGSAAGLPHKTVIVLGAPRGGTSMVAGTLSRLGVFMGAPEGLSPFYENAELGTCAKAGDRAGAGRVIARFDQTHTHWGIKVLPKSWRFWLRKGLFREPVYVVVFRDPLAVAKRRLVSKDKALVRQLGQEATGAAAASSEQLVGKYLLRELLKASFMNARLLAFLWFNRRPALVVSYEKAVTRPEDFVRGVAEFVGLGEPGRIDDAVAFVTPSPRAYVMRSSTYAQIDPQGRLFGYLDVVEPGQLAGWALAVGDEQPLVLELFVNGERVATTRADAPREDVARADPRFHPRCGFGFTPAAGAGWAAGDRVEVRVAGSGEHLVNSPSTVG